MLNCPTSFPIHLEHNTPDQPLDLSLSPLEKKIIQTFKDTISIHEISKDFKLNVFEIYNIIKKKSIIIKKNGKYTSDIKNLS